MRKMLILIVVALFLATGLALAGEGCDHGKQTTTTTTTPKPTTDTVAEGGSH